MTLRPTIRPKRCAVCREQFTPTKPLQKVCGYSCALTLATSERARAEKRAQVFERKRDRERKEAIKPRTKWLAECQAIVNKIARLRDRNDGCISCDKPKSWGGQWHGSHFRSVGAASAIRLNLWNIHKACSICNNHLSGNVAAYRPRLIQKIGAKRVEWLESQNQLVRHDIDYLKRFKATMGKRLRRMEKRYA